MSKLLHKPYLANCPQSGWGVKNGQKTVNMVYESPHTNTYSWLKYNSKLLIKINNRMQKLGA